MTKTILVIGATGKQGGATIDALVASKADVQILAVTRNPNSAGAQKLTQKSPNIKAVQGDLNDPEALFKNAKAAISQPIWGVFSVQANGASDSASPATIKAQSESAAHKVDAEERQGIALIDAAIQENVSHFVYTSVDRNGDKSFSNPTPVPHFISKHHIEHHLVKATENSPMTYTILRPVAFMDNALPGMMGKMFGTLWNIRPADMKLQLVAASDIGHFAAESFLKSDDELYKNNALSLAGAELTFAEAREVFQQSAGHDFPRTFGIFGHALLWAIYDMRMMFQWFQDEGYGADIAKLKTLHPGLKDFGTWIKEDSGYVKN